MLPFSLSTCQLLKLFVINLPTSHQLMSPLTHWRIGWSWWTHRLPCMFLMANCSILCSHFWVSKLSVRYYSSLPCIVDMMLLDDVQQYLYVLFYLYIEVLDLTQLQVVNRLDVSFIGNRTFNWVLFWITDIGHHLWNVIMWCVVYMKFFFSKCEKDLHSKNGLPRNSNTLWFIFNTWIFLWVGINKNTLEFWCLHSRHWIIYITSRFIKQQPYVSLRHILP